MLKDVASEKSKRSCFRTPFANERVNGFQTQLKSARYQYYSLFSSIRGKLSWKRSPSVWYEILRLFVNALTADDKYSGSNMQNLPQQFQTPLSLKQKTFSVFFIAFLKWALNLEHFQEKDEYPSLIFSEIIDAERQLLKRLKGLAFFFFFFFFFFFTHSISIWLDNSSNTK